MSKLENFFATLTGADMTVAEIGKAAVEFGISEKYGVRMVRKNFASAGRGVFNTGARQTAVAKAKTKKVAAKKAPVAKQPTAVAAAVAATNNVVELPVAAESRTLQRHTLADGHGVQVPVKDPTYVAHGCYSTVRAVLKSRKFAPVFITGDSGNGKTMGIAQACAAEKRGMVIVNITNETCAEDLIGAETLIDGNLVWEDGPVIRAMRAGEPIVLDELDQGTSRIMCLQTILQGSAYYIKKTGETVYPTEGFTVFGTGNTKGLGDATGTFQGAQVMNEAFLERFNIMIAQPYPTKAVEKKILGNHVEDTDFIGKLVEWAHASREAFAAETLDAKITTRRLVQIATNFEIFGDRTTALALAVERFENSTRDLLLNMYTKIDDSASLDSFEANAETETAAPKEDWEQAMF